MYEDVNAHPISKLYELGFNISLNTDNRLMSNTSVLNELEMAKLTGIEKPSELINYSASDSFLN
jgi:adenosine deaminase